MQAIWPNHMWKERSLTPGRLSLSARFQHTLTTQGAGSHTSNLKEWETGPVNKYLLWICTIGSKKKKKNSMEKMSPFLLFLLKAVQRKQVLVHSCPWAQLSVEQTPAKSQRKLAPDTLYTSASHPCSVMQRFHFPFQLEERHPRERTLLCFLYFPVCTGSSSSRRGAPEPSNLKGGIKALKTCSYTLCSGHFYSS